jgi:hypothetical protein
MSTIKFTVLLILSASFRRMNALVWPQFNDRFNLVTRKALPTIGRQVFPEVGGESSFHNSSWRTLVQFFYSLPAGLYKKILVHAPFPGTPASQQVGRLMFSDNL